MVVFLEEHVIKEDRGTKDRSSQGSFLNSAANPMVYPSMSVQLATHAHTVFRSVLGNHSPVGTLAWSRRDGEWSGAEQILAPTKASWTFNDSKRFFCTIVGLRKNEGWYLVGVQPPPQIG
jgi:hypothetical protein